jgi:gamma-glutamyltranspeptidase/glutathione hydrolase
MTDRWLNYVLTVVVIVGMVAVTLHQRPRLAEERAEFLDQQVAAGTSAAPDGPAERDPLELRQRTRDEVDEPEAPDPDEGEDEDDDAAADDEDPVDVEVVDDTPEPLGDAGVTASHPDAVAVGMQVLEAGGNAVDAAVAVAYALGVAEPFGSGPGGGGALVLLEPGGEPVAYDYRETAPASGELPASNIGVPGFVAGMEEIHERYGTIELPDLIEPAARLAEDGVEVSEYLHERIQGAGHRLPIHLVPELFPSGQAIGPGETLRQPAYAQALRTIQQGGAAGFYEGELGAAIVDEVNGLEPEDLADYEVVEVEPASGRFAGFDVLGAGAPTSSPTVVQLLQVAEALGVDELDLTSADGHHRLAQAWRQALSDRTQYLGDPVVEDVPLDDLLGDERIATLADRVDDDGFSPVEMEDEVLGSIETDTTHVVVVDEDGVMVSMTNTLSNFFGSGLPVSGFFLNDQLKNFSTDPDSVNEVAPGKRPRSFIAPMIVARDGDPVLGIGSPGGRRIPMMTAQVLVRWAAQGEDLEAATAAARFHLEGQRLELEQDVDAGVRDDLVGRGYEVTTDVPTTEYFGGMQALLVDRDEGRVTGVADDRRIGVWDALSRQE